MRHRLLRTANFRLAISYAVVFGVSVLTLCTVAYLDVRYSLDDQMRMHVKSEVDQLLRDYRDDGLDELRHDIRERMESDISNRLRYAVANNEGKVIFDQLAPVPTTEGWHHIVRRDTPLLAYSMPLKGGYTLIVAADTQQIAEVDHAMFHAAIIAVLGTIALGIIGGLFVSRRFLKRVDALSRTAESIGQGDLSQRIALSGSNDDFDQLAGTINHMLDRIELLMGEVRHVSASIAHDLRTPLAQLRNKLVALGDDADTEDALILLDETLATFTALMQLAELESSARQQHFAPLDLSALLQEMADIYAPLIEERGVLKRELAPHVMIHGNATLLRQLFANLIENALKHTQASLELTIALTSQGEVTISDNGSGIPAEQRAQVLRPFFRLDQSRSTKGSGLGLSIASAIARLHGTTLELSDNQPGLRIRINL
jgi:signal transduction histidine kinase